MCHGDRDEFELVVQRRTGEKILDADGRATGERQSHHVPGGHRMVADVRLDRAPHRTVQPDGDRRVRVDRRLLARRMVAVVARDHPVHGSGAPRIRLRLAGRGRAQSHHRTRPRIVPKRV